MRLQSSVFAEGGNIPSRYTCQGEGLSPPLVILDVPAEAKSLVLLMDDPDVPPSVRSDRMWDHWVVYDMPPTTQALKEGTTPPGTEGKNTSGEMGYEGPCPPDREHRYFFKLYALDKKLQLPPGVTKKEVEKAMEGHIVASCHLMGKYKRY